ncbi:MAG TPA: site-specific tyrosine recombinase XerD [Saprospiraceae bacterium]|nr:site-specific tyrosine recombinase XerD [Saprospiraceae bacterium]
MDWHSAQEGFASYLKLERSMSKHSVDAYMRDLNKLQYFAESKNPMLRPELIQMDDVEDFLSWLQQFNLEERSQARILSGIKAFYKYLLIEELIEKNPTELIEGPKLKRSIPDVLHIEEIDAIIASVDLSKEYGHRDKAILETLYSCGLRVSELIELLCSNVYEEETIIKVIGKGNKERLIPIGQEALNQIKLYKISYRNSLPVVKGYEDHLFLNRFGKKLSRTLIFQLVKQNVSKAGIKKQISPHTFRHSFASHLVEGGANLRAVQEMLGHESISTTEIYTHLDLNYLRETVLQFHPMNRRN